MSFGELLWWLSGKESKGDTGDMDLIPGLGRPPGEGKGKPLQYSFFFNFLNKFIHFNWRLITLQYCSGFAIHCHESTPVFLPEESHGQRSQRAIDHGVAKELDVT